MTLRRIRFMLNTTKAVIERKLSIMDSLVRESPTLGEFMGMRIASGEDIGLPTGIIVLWPTLTSKKRSSMSLEEQLRGIAVIKAA
jgi:hypothetical protein